MFVNFVHKLVENVLPFGFAVDIDPGMTVEKVPSYLNVAPGVGKKLVGVLQQHCITSVKCVCSCFLANGALVLNSRRAYYCQMFAEAPDLACFFFQLSATSEQLADGNINLALLLIKVIL